MPVLAAFVVSVHGCDRRTPRADRPGAARRGRVARGVPAGRHAHHRRARTRRRPDRLRCESTRGRRRPARVARVRDPRRRRSGGRAIVAGAQRRRTAAGRLGAVARRARVRRRRGDRALGTAAGACRCCSSCCTRRGSVRSSATSCSAVRERIRGRGGDDADGLPRRPPSAGDAGPGVVPPGLLAPRARGARSHRPDRTGRRRPERGHERSRGDGVVDLRRRDRRAVRHLDARRRRLDAGVAHSSPRRSASRALCAAPSPSK